MYKESAVRSFGKMLSWRIGATVTTVVLVYVFFGKIKVAFAIGGIEVVLKMILYYFHERIWNKINIGRHSVEPFVVWFTGLPCSGKTTLATMLKDNLSSRGYKVEHLDGDSVRAIFPKTGFSKEERNQHVKRVGFLASMLEKNKVIVLASFVSPYRESREFVRGLCHNMIEVHVNAPLEECESRDTKGMYKKARDGEIKNFTGIDDPYEAPESPELVLNTALESPEESLTKIKNCIKKYLG